MVEDSVEVERRFEFGENWKAFLRGLTPEAIDHARRSVVRLLGKDDLSGRTFLDIGCGSGLFSLAARQLGARVFSFDYDANSVGAALSVKARYRADDPAWVIERGSALDSDYVASLGKFDYVYSWGVLHHTGAMWSAIRIASTAVAPGGMFAITLYNDQGRLSRMWLAIKRVYNRLPRLLRPGFVALVSMPRELRSAAYWTLTLRPHEYIRGWTRYRAQRGMSRWHDHVDWVGGLPFEVAKPEEVIFFVKPLGFDLVAMNTMAGTTACNEYVFRRLPEPPGREPN